MSDGVKIGRDTAAKLIGTTRDVRATPVDGTGRWTGRRGGRDSFMAKITGSTRQGDKYVWAYDAQEVYKSDTGPGKWMTVADGVTTASASGSTSPAAWHTLEDMNGTGGMTGCGVDIDKLPKNPDGTKAYDLGPVPNGAIVRMYLVVAADSADTIEYHFTAVNQITGQCPVAENEDDG